jgi:hypothetical protein
MEDGTAAAWPPRPYGNCAGWRPPGTGLHTLRAATSRENTASQKVLTKAGFVPVGRADTAHIGGKSGTWYQRDVTVDDPPPPRAAAGHAADD